VVAELDYRPNLTARSLRSGRSGAYTLALPELRLPYFAQLAAATVEEARRSGIEIVIEPTDGTRESELELLGSERLRLTDGMLFAPLALSEDDIPALPPDIPMVLIGDRMLSASTLSVCAPSAQAAAAATRHLISAGRKRIAVIGGHGGSAGTAAASRLSGIRGELADVGLDLDPLLVVDSAIWHRRDGVAGARELLRRGVEFDAIIALNDMLAVGALYALSEAGIGVPDPVAVLGFDDSPEVAFTDPPLTSVNFNVPEIARLALDALSARVGGTPQDPAGILHSSWRLVERASSRALTSPTA
jgi:DNA-binding LacI/PurR family transcriptional regulator